MDFCCIRVLSRMNKGCRETKAKCNLECRVVNKTERYNQPMTGCDGQSTDLKRVQREREPARFIVFAASQTDHFPTDAATKGGRVSRRREEG